jgi:hypothetical protein
VTRQRLSLADGTGETVLPISLFATSTLYNQRSLLKTFGARSARGLSPAPCISLEIEDQLPTTTGDTVDS